MNTTDLKLAVQQLEQNYQNMEAAMVRQAIGVLNDYKPKLAVPTVHLNGTGKDGLLDQLQEALAAVNEAARKLAAASPHLRDYYTQPKGNWNLAADQHEVRMSKLREIAAELEQIGMAVVDQ